MGRLDDSLLARRRALEVSGGDPHLLGDLALLEAQSGDFGAARKALDAAGAAGLDMGPWRRRLARLLATADRVDEATAELEALAAAGVEGAALDLARLALEAEDWPAARRQAEAALEVDPGRAEAWNLLGVALRRLGEVAGALDAWQRALELDPEGWDTLYNLGTEAAAAEREELARDALSRFVAGAPAERYRADLVRARVLLRRLER
jgi:Flp pilus assembly protein TadD